MSTTIGDKITKAVMFILITLLVLSFAVWGIGDIFRGNSRDYVAKVGDKPIPQRAFERNVAMEAQTLQRMGQPTDQETLERYGIPQRVLTQMIQRTLLELKTQSLGLGMDPGTVVNRIRQDALFHNPEQGGFDKDRFEYIIRQQGMTESQYIDLIGTDMARNFLLDAVTTPAVVPQNMVNAIYAYDYETRKADILVIPADTITKVEAPTDEQLTAYYNDHPDQFTTEAFRTISYVTLSLEDVKNQVDLSEEALQVYYSQREEDFATRDILTLQHMYFTEEDKARQVYEKLQEGGDFAALAQSEAGQDAAAINYGEATYRDLEQLGLFDTTTVDKIFTTQPGKVTEPLQSTIGWHIYNVTDKKESAPQSFEDVKAGLKEDLLNEEGPEHLYQLSTEVEDSLAGGATLAEMAQELELEPVTLDAVNAAGKDKNSKDVTLPEFGNFLEQAFQLEEGDVSPLIASSEGDRYYVLQIDTVTPPQLRPLEDVREDVISAWKAQERNNQLRAMAQKAADSKAYSSLAKAAAALGLELQHGKVLTRQGGDDGGYPPALRYQLFTLPVNGTTTPYTRPEDGAYVVAQLRDIIPARKEDATPTITSGIEEQLHQSHLNVMLEQYLLYLQREYPVKQYLR